MSADNICQRQWRGIHVLLSSERGETIFLATIDVNVLETVPVGAFGVKRGDEHEFFWIHTLWKTD